MAQAMQVSGDLIVNGSIRVSGSAALEGGGVSDGALSPNAGLARTKLALDSLKPFPIRFGDWRVHDNLAALLPGTAAADDLAVTGGTFGTDGPLLVSADQASNGAATAAYARTQVRVPESFETGETLSLLLRGRMGTVADVSATVDVEAYEPDGDGSVGSDLVTTAAQSINSATFADKTFTIDASSVNPGDMLDVQIAVTIEDSATGSGVIAELSRVVLQADIRG